MLLFFLFVSECDVVKGVSCLAIWDVSFSSDLHPAWVLEEKVSRTTRTSLLNVVFSLLSTVTYCGYLLGKGEGKRKCVYPVLFFSEKRNLFF